jgi:dethiobiotin synthetase
MSSIKPPEARSAAPRVTRVVVLGTGTGVGKTWVSRALAEALRRRGAWVVASKPIETGFSGAASDGAASDGAVLARASSQTPLAPPFTFPDPVSPHLAARRAGRTIDLPTIARHVTEQANEMTSHVTPFLIVESAGGCLSPLGPALTNTDLALALEPAFWILVAPDALGVLHDVGATLAALTTRGRRPDHLVLCAAREPDASTGTNAAELRELGIASPVATIARGEEGALGELADALLAAGRS